MKIIGFLGSAAAVLLLATSASAADKTAVKAPATDSCFASSQWQGWSASGDGDKLYLKIGMHDVYQVGLVAGSNVSKEPDRFLINRVRGSDWICSPLDLDLQLSDHEGFREGLIAQSLRKLTPDEVAAIPPKDRP